MKLLRCLGYATVFVGSLAFAQTSPQTNPKPFSTPPATKPATTAKPTSAAKTAAQAPPVSNEPESTTANFGDWTLRCSFVENAGQRVRLCEVIQSLTLQGQTNPFLQIALGRVSPKEPTKLTVVLPNNISFPSVVRFSIDDKDTSPIDLAWRRCLPGGCYADSDLKDEQIDRWKQQSEKGQLQFEDAAGRKVTLPFSFRGLTQSIDALNKQ
jgi:invasion protein IalB